jgi:hypothetical protein
MKKYSVQIPQSKRLNFESCLIRINFVRWGGLTVKEYWIPCEQLEFEFEVPDGFEYTYPTRLIDGLIFNIKVTYYNKDKTKEETIELVPRIKKINV